MPYLSLTEKSKATINLRFSCLLRHPAELAKGYTCSTAA